MKLDIFTAVTINIMVFWLQNCVVMKEATNVSEEYTATIFSSSKTLHSMAKCIAG
jgi:hypothetical protein